MTVGGCLCALRALGWETCVSGINIFVLDIFCQHLGDYVNWRVSVRPLGTGLENVFLDGWGMYILEKVYL